MGSYHNLPPDSLIPADASQHWPSYRHFAPAQALSFEETCWLIQQLQLLRFQLDQQKEALRQAQARQRDEETGLPD